MTSLGREARRLGKSPATSVSVVLATFNGARFIEAQLQSLADQIELPAEVIVSDDGSTDETLSIVQGFAKGSPFPIRIFRNAVQKGYRRNFMDAAALCSSEAISFCDQDDVWGRDKISSVAPWFADDAVTMVFHNVRTVDQRGAAIQGGARDYESLPLINPPLTLSPWLSAKGFTQTFRSGLLAFSRLREESLDFNTKRGALGHDEWMFFLASSLGKIIFLRTSLADYRQHDMNLFGSRKAAPPPLSPLATLAKKLRDGADSDRQMADILKDRVSVLRQIADGQHRGDPFRMQASLAASRYSSLAGWFEHRAQIFRRPTLMGRLAAWLIMIRDGAYGSSAWAFAKKSALRDAAGVVIGPQPRNAASDAASHGRETQNGN